MPRGPLSKESKQKAALAKAEELFGVAIEQPLESIEDKMREAQSVINYFLVSGNGFKKIECRNCLQMFAYSYPYDGVKYCSIRCMAAALEKIGFKWDPSREVDRRWGRYVPAIVPPSALEILSSPDGIPKDPRYNTSS